MATEHHTFTEQLFSYSSDELRSWNAGDQAVVASLVKKSGLMGRDSKVYENQTRSGQKQNFPEACYAGHLVEKEKLARDCVLFENFRLSQRWLLNARGSGLIASNSKRIRHFLSERFCNEFDRLYDLNNVGRTLAKWHVDLFVWWPEACRAEVLEIKKYDPAGKPEPVGDHQLYFLSFVKSIAHRLGDAAFVKPGWSIHAKIIAFVPSELYATQRVKAATHSMTITV